MIKAEQTKGRIAVAIRGDYMDVIQEFTAIVNSVRERLSSEMPEAVADELISMCGKLAYTEDEDEMNDIVDAVADRLDNDYDDLKAVVVSRD